MKARRAGALVGGVRAATLRPVFSRPLALLAVFLLSSSEPLRAQGAPLSLTPEETRWIAQHRRVRLGVDPAWPPFSFIGKDGRHQGIDAELLALIGQRAGLEFELVPTKSWAETAGRMHSHEVEIAPGVADSDGQRPFVNFTRPYFSPPVAVIMREDAPFWVGLRSLVGQRIAAARGYAATAYLQRVYPEIPLVLADDIGGALDLVASRRADAVVANLVTASHLIRTRGLTNLKIVGLTELKFDLRIAVQKEEPELLAILDKALATVSERERHAIVERWIQVDVAAAIHWQLLRRVALWILLPGAGILLASLFWNRRLARELGARRKVETALRMRETELETANAGLQQLNDDRRMLMNMLAHDLNGPLSVLALSCSFLRQQIPPEARVALHDLKGMEEATDRMANLVKNLLDAESIEYGSRRFRIDACPLGAIVAGVTEEMQRVALAKRIALTFTDDSGGKVRAHCDSGAVEQIASNLVTNGLKFTPVGGKVQVRLEATGAAIRIAVEDSGPGIPPAEQPMLFEKFARLSPQPTGAEQSNGLGLAIVRLLARAMSGEVEYQDGPGGGARFVVTLPAAE